MRVRVLVLPLVAAAGFGTSVVTAGDLKVGPVKAASQPNPWNVASGAELMSDYNWRGISISARRPAVEGYIEPRYRPAESLELYSGISGSNADLPNRSRAQIAYYVGTRPTFGALSLDVGGWYIDYPGGTTFNGRGSAETCTNGAFFFGQCNTTKAVVSYFEGYAKSVLTINKALAVGSTLYYAPSWSNTGASGTYGSLTAKVTLPNSMLPHDFGASASGESDATGMERPTPFLACPPFQVE